ncbi:MAG: hypothetical protein U0903_16830 [Planctomycetales bacterium]
MMEIEIAETEVKDFLRSLPYLSPSRLHDSLRGIQIRRVDLSTAEWIGKIPSMAARGRFMIVDHLGEAVLVYQKNG